MTIESLTAVNTTDGTEIISKVVDYRQVSADKNYPIDGDGMMLLGDRETTVSKKFAKAVGEDSVEIVVFNGNKRKGNVERSLIGEEINEYSLVRYDGLEEWHWRATAEGDYPPMAPSASRRSAANLLAALHRTYDINNSRQPDRYIQRRVAMRPQRPTKLRR